MHNISYMFFVCYRIVQLPLIIMSILLIIFILLLLIVFVVLGCILGVFCRFLVIFVVLGYLWGLSAAIIAPMEVPSVIFGGFGGHLGCHLETLGGLLDPFGILLMHMLGCLFHALFMGCF